MAALTVHLDDSGTDPNQKIAVVGAWVAPVVQWKKFTRAWIAAGKEFGFSGFHMSEFVFNNPKSEFADWQNPKKHRVIRKLASIINRCQQQGFALAVNKQHYDELFTGQLREDAGKYHYTYAVRSLISAIEVWRKRRGIQQPIEYIFDRMAHQESKREIDSIFERAEQQDDTLHRFGIYKGCHSFRDRNEVLPLQAADILAWCMYRRAQTFFMNKPAPYFAAETFNYFNDRGLLGLMQTRQHMANFVASEPNFIDGICPPLKSMDGEQGEV